VPHEADQGIKMQMTALPQLGSGLAHDIPRIWPGDT
jgi:hypothetical protein